MAQLRMTAKSVVEPKPGATSVRGREKRLAVLEKLIRAIEDELADDGLDDEQKLQNIGERVAQVMDGR